MCSAPLYVYFHLFMLGECPRNLPYQLCQCTQNHTRSTSFYKICHNSTSVTFNLCNRIVSLDWSTCHLFSLYIKCYLRQFVLFTRFHLVNNTHALRIFLVSPVIVNTFNFNSNSAGLKFAQIVHRIH